MSKSEKIYKDLSQEFSDEEISMGYVFPDDLDSQVKEAANNELRKLRLQSLSERTEEQRLFAELMRMKLLMSDYFERKGFEEAFSLAKQLGQYIRVLGRTQKEFAKEIDLHPTKLSRLLNEGENPNVVLAYRLEAHCGGIIPAVYWWKLYAKKIEEEVRMNESKRKVEGNKVSNQLRFGISA